MKSLRGAGTGVLENGGFAKPGKTAMQHFRRFHDKTLRNINMNAAETRCCNDVLHFFCTKPPSRGSDLQHLLFFAQKVAVQFFFVALQFFFVAVQFVGSFLGLFSFFS